MERRRGRGGVVGKEGGGGGLCNLKLKIAKDCGEGGEGG